MFIDIKLHKDVCFLYLNKAGTNSLDQNLLDELYTKVCWASEHSHIKTVILASSLPFGFSSGLDLSNLIDAQQTIFAKNIYNAVYKSYKIVELILQSPKIFIAALSGPVIGSAASIAFSCDFRIAAKGTWFWLPDVLYGGLLADGGVNLLERLLGNSRAFMFALTNDRINLDDADKWGLIYKTVQRSQLDETALTVAKRLCGLSFKTLSSHKEIINESTLSSFRKEQLTEILTLEETHKRLQSYIKKRGAAE